MWRGEEIKKEKWTLAEIFGLIDFIGQKTENKQLLNIKKVTNFKIKIKKRKLDN